MLVIQPLIDFTHGDCYHKGHHIGHCESESVGEIQILIRIKYKVIDHTVEEPSRYLEDPE